MCVDSLEDNPNRNKTTVRLRRWGVLHLAVSIYVLLFELRVLLLHARNKWLARRYRNRRQLRLNFGCGENIKAGWINIDLSSKADLQLDLRKNLPFADSSCECTYFEHFFEHLDYPDDAVLFLRENYRVLQSGGVVSFGVPDASAALEEYVRNKANGQGICPFPGHPAWVRTGIDQINFLFRQNYIYLIHQHRYAYDFETLQIILKDVGFTDIRQRPFDPSIDTEGRRHGTLYVSAQKSADRLFERSRACL
jgi:SAM-dependent methyltransferase